MTSTQPSARTARLALSVLAAAAIVPACGDGAAPRDAGPVMDVGAGGDAAPPADGGAGRRVVVDRDEAGTPILYADTLEDAAYGLGWAMGQDRLEAVLRQLLSATGRLSEHLGPGPSAGGTAYLQADRLTHALDLPGSAAALYPTLDPGLRRYLESYAAGLDRALAEARAAGTAPAWAAGLEVTGQDVFAVTRSDDLLRKQLGEAFGDARRSPSAPCPDLYTDASASNAWAATSPITPAGRTLLLSDPHLPWDLDPLDGDADGFLPYEVHMVVAGRRYGGAAHLGNPLLSPGYSDAVAWGGTHSGVDTADVYRLTRVSGSELGYDLGGEARTLEARAVSFRVLQGGTLREERFTTYTSAIGPVVEEGGELFTAVLSLLDQPGPAVAGWALLQASGVAEVVAVAERVGLQVAEGNLVVADREGHVGYALAGRAPRRRAGVDYCHVLDASDPSVLPFFSADGEVEVAPWADHPVVVDPPTGYVVNNNTPPQTVTDFASFGEDPNATLAWHPGLYGRPADPSSGGPRQVKAREVLDAAAAASFDGAASRALALDTEVVPWRRFRPILEAVVATWPEVLADPATAAAVEAMRAWDGRVTAEATAVFAFEGWAGRMDLPGPARVPYPWPPAPTALTAAQLAAARDALVGDGSGLSGCERGVVPYLSEALAGRGGTGALLAWGEGHVLRLPGEPPAAARAMPAGDKFLQTLFMASAAMACPDFGLGETAGGSSFVMSVELDRAAPDPAAGLRVHVARPIGVVADPRDPRYGVAADAFAAGRLREIAPAGPGPAAVVLRLP